MRKYEIFKINKTQNLSHFYFIIIALFSLMLALEKVTIHFPNKLNNIHKKKHNNKTLINYSDTKQH